MGTHCRARQDRGRSPLVLGFNNGRLLPAVVPFAHREPKNVQLHDTLESAKATGFRPCKRCNPDGPSIEWENAALVAKACRLIEESEEEPSLEELAEAVGRSPELFPPHVQGRHRGDAEGICRRPSCKEGAPGTGLGQQRHRGDLRCRLQFQRTLLREVDRTCSA